MKTNKTRKAVYAASLDPITNGHINVIERMAPLYDELVVVVAVDSEKKYSFNPRERAEMTKAAVAHLDNVSVEICVGRYVVKLADELGAQVVIRGLRNFKDLEAEQELAAGNRKICPHIETILVPCLPDLMYVSSSAVKKHVDVDPHWEEQVAKMVPASVLAKLKGRSVLGKANKHWDTFMKALGNPKGSDAVYSDILDHYNDPSRSYHNLNHIVMMLDELENVSGQVLDLASIKMAIWYHDYIYETNAKDHHMIASNEARSAHHARLGIEKLGLSKEFGDKVDKLIMATTHSGPVSDPDAQFLVDLDLMTFGKPEKEFDAYTAGIDSEYAWASWPQYCAGRAKVLQSFLDRPSIYSTKFFRDKYEHTARKNVVRLLEKSKNFQET